MDHRASPAVVVVGPAARARLRRLVDAHGVEGTARLLSVARPALLRALAAVGVRRGTAHLLVAALDRVEGAGRTDPEAA
jgi:hypothetical protein